MQRRLYESTRLAEQNNSSLKEMGEELSVNQHNCERLEKELKETASEAETAWQKLKQEEKRSAVAEALVQEMRETVQKNEKNIKSLNNEKQYVISNLSTENKSRMILEKKMSTLAAHSDSQEWAYKEMLSKIEHDLSMSRSDAASVRKRMITAEAGLEREQKIRESLETKLIASHENKL
jgi:hypothetical protein